MSKSKIRSIQAGDFNLSFDTIEFSHGQITPTADGLFMPVTAYGTVSTALDTRR